MVKLEIEIKQKAREFMKEKGYESAREIEPEVFDMFIECWEIDIKGYNEIRGFLQTYGINNQNEIVYTIYSDAKLYRLNKK